VFSGFSEKVKTLLLGADWPGNVRELKNTVERSVYRADDPSLPITKVISDPFASAFGAPPIMPAVERAAADPQEPAADAGGHSYPLSFKETVAAFEQDLLAGALERSRHNQRIAADLLGLSYHQLRGLVRKYGA
jgi:psp operon transcriptional activator